MENQHQPLELMTDAKTVHGWVRKLHNKTALITTNRHFRVWFIYAKQAEFMHVVNDFDFQIESRKIRLFHRDAIDHKEDDEFGFEGFFFLVLMILQKN